eukprot:7007053-Karenia_brevis.AAC.1
MSWTADWCSAQKLRFSFVAWRGCSMKLHDLRFLPSETRLPLDDDGNAQMHQVAATSCAASFGPTAEAPSQEQ